MKPIICIDPGHGGKDPGALGPGGLKEADVVLSVALLLAELLRPALKVVLTRSGNTFVELGKRAQIANAAGADLFLSIHCNSAQNPAAGIETFVATGTTISRGFGGKVQEALTRRFPRSPDRGLKVASFAVLKRTKMRAALGELEFIHTPAGEALLKSVANQKIFAAALAEAVFEELGIVQAGGVAVPGPTPEAFKTSFATVTEAQIDALLDEAEVSEHQFWGKEMLVSYRLRCGWSVTGRSACVDPANFKPDLGRKFAREDAKRQLWMLEGYRLQWELAGAS